MTGITYNDRLNEAYYAYATNTATEATDKTTYIPWQIEMDNGNTITALNYEHFDGREQHLFDFCCRLRKLFQEHFENGDMDISDEEFWAIIKA